MLSGCQPGITKAAGILKRKVNTTDRQKTDRQTDRQKKKKKKTGTECILIWENGSWLTTVNVNALSSLPTHGSLLLSKSPFLPWASWRLGQRALPAGPEQWTGFAWALPSRDHVSPPGAAARPQGVQTSQYRPVVATGRPWAPCCVPTGLAQGSLSQQVLNRVKAVSVHCLWRSQASGSCSGGSTIKYFVL